MTETREKVEISGKTQEQCRKALLDLANGGVRERIAYEIPRILANIKDPNTSAKKIRSLTIKVNFVPSEDRRFVSTNFTVQPKLQPTDPITTTLMLYDSDSGVQAIEVGEQIPGQRDLDGNEEPQAALLEQIN